MPLLRDIKTQVSDAGMFHRCNRCIGDGLTMKRTTGGICGVQDPSQAEQLSAFATLRL